MFNFKTILFTNLFAIISSTSICFAFQEDQGRYGSITSPEINPDQLCELPFQVRGVKTPVINLNGAWWFCKETDQDNWFDKDLTWGKINVPGEPAMQGYPVKHDTWYAYRANIEIPKDFAGKKIILRFNGVYGEAKVWVNGTYLRSHQGGFTAWECDIAQFVQAGNKSKLVVAFRDNTNDISYASGYAKHPIGGILRNVELICLSEPYISRLDVGTAFNEDFSKSSLTLNISVKGKMITPKVRIRLYSPEGIAVALPNSEFALDENLDGTLQNTIPDPEKWDAEHPNLYSLIVEILAGDNIISSIKKKIGFRQVEVKGDQLLVNGKPIKLRGACRHDIHPLLGRSASDEFDLKDVQMAKEANINFIRTSHYPPSRAFLEYCDQYGIYVEEETAVCFVSTYRSDKYQKVGASQDEPAFSSHYLGQLSEMVERDRNHPSVIIWSLGNESTYGSNFKKEHDFVKSTDNTRPIIFSYPGNSGVDTIYDILSMHYVNFDGNMEQSGFRINNFSHPGMPVIHDEWAHIPCYNTFTLGIDPNINEFWGESLDRMWSGCFDSKGCAGGAIWGMIDETFMLPDTVVGYGQWGIVDTWRRPKPEFWNTKKAYSPARITSPENIDVANGKDILLDLYNRFDHSNISELKIFCNGEAIQPPSILPHSKGKLIIPGDLASKPGPMEIEFFSGDLLIDKYRFDTQPKETVLSDLKPNLKIEVKESPNIIEVSGQNFTLTIDKNTGLIASASCNGQKIIDGGPYLTIIAKSPSTKGNNEENLVETAGDWTLSSFDYTNSSGIFSATSKGTSGIYQVEFTILISGDGEISTRYRLENNPLDVHESGIYYKINHTMDQLQWTRDAYWSVYPEGHIGRPEGFALKTVKDPAIEKYRIAPKQSWENDTKDFFLYGTTGKKPLWFPSPNDFRSSKLNILSYSLTGQKTGTGIELRADGNIAVRSETDEDGSIKLKLLDRISYNDLGWGNYERPDQLQQTDRNYFRLFLLPGGKRKKHEC